MTFINLLLGLFAGMAITSDVDNKLYIVLSIIVFIYIYNYDKEGFLGG